MITKIKCPNCGQRYELDDYEDGARVACQVCNQEFVLDMSVIDELQPDNTKGNQNERKKPSPAETTETTPIISNGRKQYKILTQKDEWFSGKFDPESLERAINGYAELGWRVVSSVTATFPGFITGNREEMVIIMERDKLGFTKYDDVYFVEGMPAKAVVLKDISTVLDGILTNSQRKSINDIMHDMAMAVKAEGGNAVVSFKYGQRVGGIRQQINSLDNVYWYAEGKIAKIEPKYL